MTSSVKYTILVIGCLLAALATYTVIVVPNLSKNDFHRVGLAFLTKAFGPEFTVERNVANGSHLFFGDPAEYWQVKLTVSTTSFLSPLTLEPGKFEGDRKFLIQMLVDRWPDLASVPLEEFSFYRGSVPEKSGSCSEGKCSYYALVSNEQAFVAILKF